MEMEAVNSIRAREWGSSRLGLSGHRLRFGIRNLAALRSLNRGQTVER